MPKNTGSDKPVKSSSAQSAASGAASGAAPRGKAKPARQHQAGGQRLNLIGVFILAFGLAAFVAVLYLGYVRFVADDTAEQGGGIEAALRNQTDQAASPQQDVKALGKVKLAQLPGKWRTKYGVNTVELVMQKDGQYAITLYTDSIGRDRMFSKGTSEFDEEEGLLSLKPSYDPMPEVEGANYAALNYNPYDVVVLYRADTGSLYWVSGSMVGRRSGLHPLFVRLGRRDNYIEWTRAR